MSNITTVLVDGDPVARQDICQKLKATCPQVELLAQAGSVLDGIEAVLTHQPDVIIIDVTIQGNRGFEILETIEVKRREGLLQYQVLFVVEHDGLAIQAIKYNALDYILKPVDIEDLKQAFDRVPNASGILSPQLNLQMLLESLSKGSNLPKKITIPTSEGIHLYNVADIVRCESQSNYTRLYLKDGSSLLASKTLKEYDALTHQYGFERVHKSHLVNLNFLKKYVPTEGAYLVMEDGSEVPVSQRKKERLVSLLKAL